MDDESVQYAKAHRKEFFEQVIDGYVPDVEHQRAIFMAGSPGAGKTEVAKGLKRLYPSAIRIDADRFREDFPGYNGQNAAQFQRGAAFLVDTVFDRLVKKHYSFILDGTFAINKSLQNVERVLHHGYKATICYVCQDPIVAWNFTKGRAEKEGRVVPKDRFINAYYESRENFLTGCKKLGDQVGNIVVYKSYDNNIADVSLDVLNPELVLPPLYDRKYLEGVLDNDA